MTCSKIYKYLPGVAAYTLVMGFIGAVSNLLTACISKGLYRDDRYLANPSMLALIGALQAIVVPLPVAASGIVDMEPLSGGLNAALTDFSVTGFGYYFIRLFLIMGGSGLSCSIGLAFYTGRMIDDLPSGAGVNLTIGNGCLSFLLFTAGVFCLSLCSNGSLGRVVNRFGLFNRSEIRGREQQAASGDEYRTMA